MSSRDRARKRQIYEIPRGEGERDWVLEEQTAPRYVVERQKRREWFESNRNKALEREVLEAVSTGNHYLPIGNRRSPLELELGKAMDKGLLGITEVEALEDNPREVKARLPKAIALMEECLEELAALGVWKRSLSAPKLSE